jgi:putative transposase
MPSRNVLKIDMPESYYHVYARGNSRLPIFLGPEDYAVFLNLLKRYLSILPNKDTSGREYPHLRGKVELLAYCLMSNHFHMLLYQIDEGAMSALMRGVMTSYSRYFNSTHKRSGPLFESRYKAAWIANQAYLEHISRYIHLNPKDWGEYPYSSIHSYLGKRNEEWLQPERILEQFSGKAGYLRFVEDYKEHKHMLDKIKYELADS